MHPALLDRLVGAIAQRYISNPLPLSYGQIKLHQPLEKRMHAFGRSTDGSLHFELYFLSEKGELLLEVMNYRIDNMEGTRLVSPGKSLEIAEEGVLQSMTWGEEEVRRLGPNEVQVEVVSAGLNFRDVLIGVGRMESPHLGSEASGKIVALGENVEGFKMGDPVMVAAPGCLRSHLTLPVSCLAPLPHGISYEEGAGLPIAFLTAAWSLESVARLQAGERVLIHAASGGVGLAAIQIARELGAEIYCTAGNESKRQLLRNMGVKALMDSRSLDFVDEILETTEGEGVDVVLDSLAGDFVEAGLKVLRPFGRFVEIGKRDIQENRPMALGPFVRNLQYLAVDLGPMMAGGHPELSPLFHNLAARFERGELQPGPTRVFDHLEVVAFEHLSRARHIGKVVLRFIDQPKLSKAEFRSRFGPGIETWRGEESLRQLICSDQSPAMVLATSEKLDGGRDRGELPDELVGPKREDLGIPYRKAENDIQEKLVEIWERVIGITPIGIDDNLVRLGADSIAAIQIQFAIEKNLGHRVGLGTVFDHPTIAEFFQHLVSLER